ncbi:uncharacterized protein [Apostichopus japonicus]|uniref:uncharacterized protein isoform X3 n=1 Tax=Stichopus japonicus TaxID=307972 RepID=UPI003AB67700
MSTEIVTVPILFKDLGWISAFSTKRNQEPFPLRILTKEVATEGVYEQEDSDQDDSIDQPGDIKKGHSLNDVQKTGVEIANSQRQTEENTMDYSGASSSPPARRSKHCIIKVAWKVSNSELHESGTMSL